MNKKYIAAGILFITLFSFSVKTAHASFFSNIIHSIFGQSSVSNSNLGASAIGAFSQPQAPTTAIPTATTTVVKEPTATTVSVVASTTLTVAKDPNDAPSHTVSASSTGPIQNVTLGIIDLTSAGSNSTLSSLPVTLNVVNNGSASTDAGAVVNILRLYNSSGMQIDSEVVPMTAKPQIVFHNFPTLTIAANSTQVFTVKGDIQPIDGTLVKNGASATITVNVKAIKAVDANDKAIVPVNLLGASVGPIVHFSIAGISVAPNGTPSNTYYNPGGAQTNGILTMTIPFSVTAFGSTSYVPSQAKFVTSGTVANPTAINGPYIEYAIDNGSSLQSVSTATVTYTGSDGLAVDSKGNYQIPVGQTKNFNLVITSTPTITGSYRAQLVSVNNNLTDSATAYSTYTVGLNAATFKTGYVTAGSQVIGGGTYPPGCTSNVGYSTTTGQSCNGGTSANTTPAITIVSPNGGQSYQPNQTFNVTWTSANIPTSAKINFNLLYYVNGVERGGINLGTTSNTGTDAVTIPSNLTSIDPVLQLGNNFKIVILAYDSSNNFLAQDLSDNYFSVSTATTNPTSSQAQMIAQLIDFPSAQNSHTDLGCNGTRYSTTTGLICDGTENDVSSAFTNDPTPRIMEWQSKVNQHIDAKGIWQTDPDGTSGAQIDPLTYCKKWYPGTVSIQPYKTETISTWHEAGNVNNWRYTTTSEQCVQ